MKRSERIRNMMDKGKWKEGDPVFGLPKIKAIRIKIKKEKAEKAETTAEGTAATTAPGAASAATTTSKAAAKPATAKAEKEKK